MQHFHHFAVDPPWRNAELAPDLLPLFRRAGEIHELALLLSELLDELERDLFRHLVHGLALDIDAEVSGHAVQLANILDLEVLRLAARHSEQGIGKVSGMV